MKFVTGRIDCDNSEEVIDCIDEENIEEYGLEGAGFVTCKKEVCSKKIFWIVSRIPLTS